MGTCVGKSYNREWDDFSRFKSFLLSASRFFLTIFSSSSSSFFVSTVFSVRPSGVSRRSCLIGILGGLCVPGDTDMLVNCGGRMSFREDIAATLLNCDWPLLTVVTVLAMAFLASVASRWLGLASALGGRGPLLVSLPSPCT